MFFLWWTSWLVFVLYTYPWKYLYYFGPIRARYLQMKEEHWYLNVSQQRTCAYTDNPWLSTITIENMALIYLNLVSIVVLFHVSEIDKKKLHHFLLYHNTLWEKVYSKWTLSMVSFVTLFKKGRFKNFDEVLVP